MKLFVLFFTALLCCAYADAADPAAPKPPAAPDDAMKGQSASAKKRIDWFDRNMNDAYDAGGLKDPKWDRPAKSTINALVIMASRWPFESGDEPETIYTAAGYAIAQGCNDPLVFQASAGELATLVKGWKESSKYANLALENVDKAHYGPAVKILIDTNAAFHLAYDNPDDAEALKKSRALMDKSFELLPAAFEDKSMPASEAIALIASFGNLSVKLEKDRKVFAAKAIAILEKSPQDKSTILTARGVANIAYGWDARGDGFANTVTAEGAQKLDERLDLARGQLEEAFKLDPTNDEAATAMITVEMGKPTGRAAMETWFKRAMKADPNSVAACNAKLTYLEPKWYGSFKQMMAFGRECRKTGSWETGMVPMTLVNAHWTAAYYGPDGLGKQPRREYFMTDPSIWEDINGVYQEYFARKNKRVAQFHKTRYAILAAWCGHYKEADAMFSQLGKVYSRRLLPGEEAYEELKREAAEKRSK